MAEAPDVARIRARAARREQALSRMMLTEDGAELLRALEAEFYDCDLMCKTPEETAFKLGARQVVVFMRHAREKAMKDG